MEQKIKTSCGYESYCQVKRLVTLKEYFGDREFTRKEYDQFCKTYDNIRYGHDGMNIVEYKGAPIFRTIASAIESKLIAKTREELLGQGKRYYYVVNDNYLNDIIEDMMWLKKIMVDKNDEYIQAGQRLVNAVKEYE